ncbi:STAS domain-containing protein [Streptomyces sp. NPDC047315]|uniref:STAS domain-containing protein n=1 Tax=Streptomyces sp. NPDC047315 TaxID=3155142 RepID=UPI003411EEB2
MTGKVTRSDVPQLCAELGARIDEQQHQGAVPVDAVCDVGALPADLVAVEAVARLHLTARRHGCRLRLHDVRPELRELLHLVGLGSLAEAAEPQDRP